MWQMLHVALSSTLTFVTNTTFATLTFSIHFAYWIGNAYFFLRGEGIYLRPFAFAASGLQVSIVGGIWLLILQTTLCKMNFSEKK